MRKYIDDCKSLWHRFLRTPYMRKISSWWEEKILNVPESNRERFVRLAIAAAGGIPLAFVITLIYTYFTDNAPRITDYIALISIPVLFVLWLFRTHDVREQIEKTQENINSGLYNKGVELLANKDSKNRKYGILILSVLRKRELFAEEIDLITSSKLDLENAYLREANLANMNLEEIQLKNAILLYADLREANLSFANLKEANLQNTNMTNTKLVNADLTEACLVNADLTNANLIHAILTNANLASANLMYANLQHTKLTNANLTSVNLTHANLVNANLAHADLRHADLAHADLTHADLTHADLTHANFGGGLFVYHQEGKILVASKNLEEDILKGAIYDNETIFPEGFNPEEHGMIKKE